MSRQPREGLIAELAKRPVSIEVSPVEGAMAYRDVPLTTADPLLSEPLSEVREHGIAGRNHYFHEWNPPYHHRIPGAIPNLWVRNAVALRLAAINGRLRPWGLELFVLDAFRPLIVQNYFYFHWFPEHLRALHPGAAEDWIIRETERYWAPGARSPAELARTPPPHSTGGAVDLTLRHIETQQLLEMGTIFDDVTERSHADYFEAVRDMRFATITDLEARRNRRLLAGAMALEGFAVHPREWWHYSWGDQMWALANRRQAAPYGYAGALVGEVLPWTSS